MTAILAMLAAVGWFSYLLERDTSQFHKKMSDYWYEQATRMTDRWLTRVEEDAAASSAGGPTPA